MLGHAYPQWYASKFLVECLQRFATKNIFKLRKDKNSSYNKGFARKSQKITQNSLNNCFYQLDLKKSLQVGKERKNIFLRFYATHPGSIKWYIAKNRLKTSDLRQS